MQDIDEKLEKHEHEEHCCEHEHHEHHHEHEEHCCEHEHHEHHHEHEHCCEHEHHEHHHEHEEHCCEHEHHEHEECSCGHDHHHEHGDCECGCDHDHEHEHETPEGYKIFDTHVHEGATVCSFEKDVKMDYACAVKAMEAACNEVESWLKAKCAIIGHVKGYVRQNGTTSTFSTVGGGLNMSEHEGVGAAVGFASIVFGVDEETLKDKVTEVFSEIR